MRIDGNVPSSPQGLIICQFPHGEQWAKPIRALTSDMTLRVEARSSQADVVGLAMEFAIGLDACDNPYARQRGLLPPDHRTWIDEQLADPDPGTASETILRVALYLAKVYKLLYWVLERGTPAEGITDLIARGYCIPPQQSSMDDELRQLWDLYEEAARAQIRGLGPATADVRLHERISPIHGKHADAIADLVAGSTIIDIKTRTLGNDDMWLAEAGHQLLRYGLLADTANFDIDTVGLYLARYGRLLTWPLFDLAEELAGYPIDLGKERQEIRHL